MGEKEMGGKEMGGKEMGGKEMGRKEIGGYWRKDQREERNKSVSVHFLSMLMRLKDCNKLR